jgi:hypothetical protein
VTRLTEDPLAGGDAALTVAEKTIESTIGRLLFACVAAVACSASVRAQEVPELVFQKPVPVTRQPG